MTRRKFQTSAEVMLDSGLYFMSEPGPPSWPSKAGSTCTTGISALVPGLWSLRWPVIQARSVLSFCRSGRTCVRVNVLG